MVATIATHFEKEQNKKTLIHEVTKVMKKSMGQVSSSSGQMMQR